MFNKCVPFPNPCDNKYEYVLENSIRLKLKTGSFLKTRNIMLLYYFYC